jgi:hypothetical protein
MAAGWPPEYADFLRPGSGVLKGSLQPWQWMRADRARVSEP